MHHASGIGSREGGDFHPFFDCPDTYSGRANETGCVRQKHGFRKLNLCLASCLFEDLPKRKASSEIAGTEHNLSWDGYPEPFGDANLDGKTNVLDFSVWNAHKFTTRTDWQSGDFDGNGRTNVLDFTIWNEHKFTSVPAPLPLAHDAVLEQVVREGASAEAVAQGEIDWLHDLMQADKQEENSDDVSSVERAVDGLLASFWP